MRSTGFAYSAMFKSERIIDGMKEETLKLSGAYIRALRTDQGITRIQIDKELGLSESSRRRLERGEQDVGYSKFVELLEYLGGSEDDIRQIRRADNLTVEAVREIAQRRIKAKGPAGLADPNTLTKAEIVAELTLLSEAEQEQLAIYPDILRRAGDIIRFLMHDRGRTGPVRASGSPAPSGADGSIAPESQDG